jgi:hypothetical protein
MTTGLFSEVYKNHPYMNGYRWMTFFMHRCTSLKCLCANQQSQTISVKPLLCDKPSPKITWWKNKYKIIEVFNQTQYLYEQQYL